jgi:putative PIN family toxin of toxin-antitoxin system
MNAPIPVVYDCMIFLQAVARPSRVHGTMRVLQESRIELCISPDIVAELGDVLNRPELLEKFPELRPTRVRVFFDDILARARMHANVPRVFSLPRDKKDEPYINLAIAADAPFLVTWNDRHLTYLMREDSPEGREFRSRYPQIKIVDPPAFLRSL